MRTPANIARHPIHPMLVPIAIGLWLVYVHGVAVDGVPSGSSRPPEAARR